MDSFVTAPADVCKRNFLAISECRLAIVVKTANERRDKRITAAWLPFARSNVRLCKVVPRVVIEKLLQQQNESATVNASTCSTK